MVLAVLAVAWGTVLFFWFRSRGQGSFADSVGLFHRHLHVLERAAPGTLAPANSMRGPAAGPIPLSSRMARTAPPEGQSRPYPRAVARPVARQQVARHQPAGGARRREGQRRRRDVLFVLVVLVAATLVLAAGTGSHTMMMAQILTDVALVAYVALLVRLRNVAAERDMKLRVMQRPTSSRMRAERYSPAAGYGDLALRRVAN